MHTSETSHLSPEEAREWVRLQMAICEQLSTRQITAISQINPALVEAFQVHFATCHVENHPPIPGLFTTE